MLALEVELPGVADFTVRGPRLEHSLRTVRCTVRGHTPNLRGRSTEVFEFGWECWIPGVNLLSHFWRNMFRPAARELVPTGNNLTRTLREATVFDVICTADKPFIDKPYFVRGVPTTTKMSSFSIPSGNTEALELYNGFFKSPFHSTISSGKRMILA